MKSGFCSGRRLLLLLMMTMVMKATSLEIQEDEEEEEEEQEQEMVRNSWFLFQRGSGSQVSRFGSGLVRT